MTAPLSHISRHGKGREPWPPPDPSTRVALPWQPLTGRTRRGRSRRTALTAGAGAAAIVAASTSTAADQPHLPLTSRVAVAGLGVVLVGVAGVRRRPSAPTTAPAVGVVAPPADLPSLTGQISGVLSDLRRRYGIAYRTRTWIDDMLPAYGATLTDPGLARDVLGAAALDAGGIRADVARLADAHDHDDIVATASAILAAVQNVLAACEVPTELLPTPLPSDPSSWP